MAYSVIRGYFKKTGRRTATLMERVETQDGPLEITVASGEGATDMDAAVALDVAVQGMRAASQLNYVRSKEQQVQLEEAEEALHALLGGEGDQSPVEGNN